MRRSLPCIAVVLAACLGLAACGGREDIELLDASGGGDGGGPFIPGLVSITVTPDDTSIVIADLAVTETQQYRAEGRFEDGSSRDISAEVAWGVDNPAPGAIADGGLWSSSNAAGGPVLVAAQANGMTVTADLAVILQPVIDDPGFPPPPGAEDLFDDPVVSGDPTRSPRIVYPAHQVMFPLNVYRVLFQHDTGAGNDVYRLRFVSPYLDMKVYTTSDRWQADAVTWGFLALTNAGGAVEMTVSAVDLEAPGTVWASTPITIELARSNVEGAIYYWSTSSEGVMKGVISEPAPTKFYTQAPDTTCVACHTVSRNGQRMAVGYDGERLQEITIPGREVVIPAGTHEAGWSTFAPDASRLVIASKGVLTLLDADTGSPIGLGGGVIPTGGVDATHPDWSPIGGHVAVAVCTNAGNDKDVEGCGIGRIPFFGDTWGPLELLVTSTGPMDNNYFPRYSPDGNWIVYVHATGKSKDQPTAELRLIRAEGGTPITLTRANQRVGPLDGQLGLGNTMPTWAPSTHPGTQWLALSSIRPYGKIVTGADQLWVVALDLSLAPDADPSYAAFWLPLQDAVERNHRAFWALDADVPCQATDEVCDGFDNDCDGIVDEDCVPCAEPELCFDHLDNNCNGMVDELCVD